MVKRNYILQKIPLVVLDSTSSSSSGDNLAEEDTATSSASPTLQVLLVPPIVLAAPALPVPPVAPVSPVNPISPIVSRFNTPVRGPAASDDSGDHPPQYLGEPPIFPRNTHWMRGQLRKTTGLPSQRQLAQRDFPHSTPEVGESSQRPTLRAQLQTVTTELEEVVDVIRETRNSLGEATRVQQGLVEQVNALEAGGRAWQKILENRIHDSANLIERNYVEAMWQATDYQRMLMAVAMVAVMAVMISVLSLIII